MKPIIRCCLAALLLASATASAGEDRALVDESNRNARLVLDVLAQFNPEAAANIGVEGHDGEVIDLGPKIYERNRDAVDAMIAELRRRREGAGSRFVREDLDILITASEQNQVTAKLEHDLLIPYVGVGQLVFQAMHSLLDPRVAKDRQAHALERVQRYAGLAPGTQPVTQAAEARMVERFDDGKLLGPYRGRVEQDLADSPRYIEGLRQLFVASGQHGYESALDTLTVQLNAHDDWVKKEILPRARADYRLPPALYADALVQVGVDVEPDELIRRALIAFAEYRNEANALAPLVAKARGIKATGYRDVIAALKKDQVQGPAILPLYQKRLQAIESILRREHIITVPARAAVIKLATEAESAAQPAPHMSPPRLLGNTGEYGEFVLPLVMPGKAGRESLRMDDFTFDAATWTLTAHEARPGHELQFAAMIEKGVSVARAVFAFNSVNVEGWALYAEAEMKPYFPLDGQLIGLQARMQRAARAFLDPMVNLGRMSADQARAFLMTEVGLSAGMAQQEADRYTFRAPGQATSYFYGYQAMMAVRQRAQLLLGPRFDRQRFNDFVIAQGLLPPALLQSAVLDEFVPAELKPTAPPPAAQP